MSARKIATPAAQAAAVKSATVSYTHLRAHETVLDLVCRLLLEKKKQPRAEILIIVPTNITVTHYTQNNIVNDLQSYTLLRKL